MSIECACICDSGWDADGPSVFNERRFIARKNHACCECGGVIRPGERYERTDGCWDGRWETYKTCGICLRIRGEYCCSWVYGGLREDLWSAFGMDYVTGEMTEDTER